MTGEEIAEAARRVLAGDKDEFTLLVREHEALVRAFLGSHIADSHTVDDLAQETFIAAYENLGRYNASMEFRPWIRTIARNKLMSHLRAEYRRRGVREELRAGILEEMSAEVAVAAAEDRPDALERLRRCMAKLGERARAMLEARYYRQQSVREIAERMGTTPNAVSTVLSRGRVQLASCMKGENP